MTASDTPELESALRALTEHGEAIRDARDQLAARDERFAALEAEMWAGFEAREVRHRELIEQREQEGARLRGELVAREQEVAALRAEIARLQGEARQRAAVIAEVTEENFRMRVRLQRIIASPPGRLYAALLELPGLQLLRRWRAHHYESALARQRPS